LGGADSVVDVVSRDEQDDPTPSHRNISEDSVETEKQGSAPSVGRHSSPLSEQKPPPASKQTKVIFEIKKRGELETGKFAV